MAAEVTVEKSLIWAAVVAALFTVTLCEAPAAGMNCSDFVRRSCSAALYPSLCYSSLAGYACAAGPDPTKIAHFATNLSLAQVRSLSYHVLLLNRAAAATAGGIDGRTAAALSDCAESLDDAVDLTRQAAAELGLLAATDGPEWAWHVGNAQTWMSAALTNEDTCADGFAKPAAAATRAGAATPVMLIKGDVTRRVRRAREYTSIALALVNRLVGATR